MITLLKYFKLKHTMVIAEETVVSLQYTLRLDSAQGEIVETVDAERPLKFIYGIGQLLPLFEENLKGLKTNDSFAFTLKPEDAYGLVSDDYVVDVPKRAFVVNGELREDLLQVGKQLPMRDSNGSPINGTIIKIGDENVTMDFNHPMAGKTLAFSGSVVEVRQASADELESGYPEGMGGGGCGCGSGGCGSGGCGDDDCGCESEGGGCNSGSCGCK